MQESAPGPGGGGRAAEFRGKRAATNATVVLFGQFAFLAIALVTTPIALNRLGIVEFGVWTFVVTAVNYVALVDPGFSDLVTRYGARARTLGDRHLAARISAAGTLLWLAFGAVCAPLVVLVVPWAVHLVPLSAHHALAPSIHNAAITFFYWSFGLLIFGCILATLSGQLVAIGDQWLVTSIDVATRVLYGATLLVLLFHGWRLNAIIAATAVQYGLAFAATLVAISVRAGAPYADPRRLEPALRRELVRFGGLLQLNSLLDTLTFETDPIVLGLAVGAEAAGVWGVAQRVGQQIPYFANVPQQNVLPAMAASHAANEGLIAMRRIYVRSQRIIVLAGAFVAGLVMAFGPVLLKAWTGRSFTVHDDATVATILIALTMMAGLPRAATGNAILAVGRVGLGTRAQWLAFGTNVVLTASLVVPFGLTGVLAGTVAAKVVATTYLLTRFCRIMESSWRELVWPWLGPLLVVTGACAVLGRLVMGAFPGATFFRAESLWAAAVLGLGYSVCYVVGLRLCRYFSAVDLRWMRDAAPGRTGRLLPDRVIRLLAGHS